MYRLSLLIVGVVLAVGACDDSKKYPTAPAPKTLKIDPMAAMARASGTAAGEDDDDLDDDEGGGGPMRAPEAMSGPTRASMGGLVGGGPVPGGIVPAGLPGATATINGHPEGPKAEVFNAVVNTAFANALSCFAKATGDQTLSFRVEMTVGNQGAVEEAKVISGPELEEVRSCLVGVVKRLTFPAFKGPKVSQTIPFAAVRQGGGAATP